MSSPFDSGSAPSRRALLTGALGGLGALAASAIGRRDRAAAGLVAVYRDMDNPTSLVTSVTTAAQGVTAFTGASTTGIGLKGNSAAFWGVEGISGSDWGVYGLSSAAPGVVGQSLAADQPAAARWSITDSTGIQGYSNDGSGGLPTAKAKTGVYGYAAQDSSSKGVFGESPAGWGGYFVGKVYTSKFHEMQEISAPAAPGLNKGRLFLRDNGSGRTQLCVRFNTGAIQVLATQP